MGVAIAKFSELESCWRPERFCGGECKYLLTCHKNRDKDGRKGPLRDCKAYLKTKLTEVVFGPGAGGIDYQI
jgi:hypothetical protein